MITDPLNRRHARLLNLLMAFLSVAAGIGMCYGQPLELKGCAVNPQRTDTKVVDVLSLSSGNFLVASRFTEGGNERWAVDEIDCSGDICASMEFDRRVNALCLSPSAEHYYVLGGAEPLTGDTTGFIATIEKRLGLFEEHCRELTPGELYDGCLITDNGPWLMTTGVGPSGYGDNTEDSTFVSGYDVASLCPAWPPEKWAPLELNGSTLVGEKIDCGPKGEYVVVSGRYVGKPLIEGTPLNAAGQDDGFVAAFDASSSFSLRWVESLGTERPEVHTRHVTQTEGETVWVISSSATEASLFAYHLPNGKPIGSKPIGTSEGRHGKLRALDIALFDRQVVVLITFEDEWSFPLGYTLGLTGVALLRYDAVARLQSVQQLPPKAFFECGALDISSDRLAVGYGDSVYHGKNDSAYVPTLVAFKKGEVLAAEDIFKCILSLGGYPYTAVPSGTTRAVGGAWFPSSAIVSLPFMDPRIDLAGEELEFERTAGMASIAGSDWFRKAINATPGTHTSQSTPNPAVLFVIDGDPSLSPSFSPALFHQVQSTEDESSPSGDTSLPTAASSKAPAEHATQVTSLAVAQTIGVAAGIAVGTNPVNVFPALPPSGTDPHHAYGSAVYAGLCRTESKWAGIASDDEVGVDKVAATLPVVLMPVSTVHRIPFQNQKTDSLDASLISIRDALECLAGFAVVIVTAGNNAGPVRNGSGGYYPAAFRSAAESPGLHDNMLVVGATRNPIDQPYTLTNYGDEVDLWAPGQGLQIGGTTNSGTSMAAALVAGVVVRLLADTPERKSGPPVRNPSAIRNWLLTAGCGSDRYEWCAPLPDGSTTYQFLNASGSRIALWQARWGLASPDFSLDGDGDTITNGMEFLTGSNPTHADFVPWKFQTGREGTNGFLEFEAAAHVTPRDLLPEWSPNINLWLPLLGGTWSETGMSGGMKQMRYDFSTSPSAIRQFFRVTVREKP